ncbi:DUF2637 domain-containing protein [Nocardia sp. XZ_19_385]|uniref:DUF2637 domain-containing protein n=1 Tax=Nocardia sp. XZ_19_385 TaxID=2769488 RepID=UPI00188E7014|nr:DUF2637 domain-containing protein [Nocardia sp. XZ_19_385]
MTTSTDERATANSEQLVTPSRQRLLNRLWDFRLRPLHASAAVSAVVAYKAFEMSFAALHNLAVHNLVEPRLASNVPLAIDGLMVGAIVATASFRKNSLGWWYATILFALSTLVSVAGNIQYAREIGGGVVAVAIYAGMPLTMLFAVHLTLLLWSRSREAKLDAAAALNAVPETAVPEMTTDQRLAAWVETNTGEMRFDEAFEAEHAALAAAVVPSIPVGISPLAAAARQSAAGTNPTAHKLVTAAGPR